MAKSKELWGCMMKKSRQINASELNISPIGFGSWPLAEEGRPSESEAIKIIHTAIEAGLNFIDTADAYCKNQDEFGYCEQLIAKALKTLNPATPVIVATKGGCTRPEGRWATNGSPKYLKKACEASLKSLNVECIDLYQLHAPDPTVPFIESVGALADLKQAGKIRYVGLSNVTVPEIDEARTVIEIVSVQNRFNPFDITSFENGVIAYCEENNLAFIAYSPVGGKEEKHLTEKNPHLIKIANEHHVTPFQIALAWLLSVSPMMIPIPAATKIPNAISSAKAMDIRLHNAEVVLLDKVFGLI